MAVEGQRVLVVTGASSGIGRALAIRMAGPGCRVWLIARDAGRLEEVAAEVRRSGAEARPVVLDLRDAMAVAGFFEGELAAEERVDEVYLVAAVSLFGEVKDLTLEDWERIYQTNLLSVAQWVTGLYPRMVAQGGGRMVIVSSLAAHAGYPTAVPYAAMKGGLAGLFRSLTHEARFHGVDLRLVSPGYVDTGIYRSAVYRNTSYEATLRQVERMGFAMIGPERAAEEILRRIERGDREIVFPGYARMLVWAARRLPWILPVIHARLMREFRKEVGR